MRSRLRLLLFAAGLGAVIVLLLLVIATATGSLATAIAAGAIGTIGIAIVCVAALKIVDRFVATNDRFSTRAKNLETRSRALEDHAQKQQALSAAAQSTQERLATALDDVHRTSEQTNGSLKRVTSAHEATVKAVSSLADDVRVLENRVPAGFLDPMQERLEELSAYGMEATRTAFESAIQQGRGPKELYSQKLAHKLFQDYMKREDYIRLRPLIENFDVLETQSLTNLRAIYRFFRSSGYWDLAQRVVEKIYGKSGRENDAHAVEKIKHEVELFSQPLAVRPDLPDADAYNPSGPVLHMVGRVLPETQTGYTLRTHYTVKAQLERGLPVAIVGQAGIVDREVGSTEKYEYQGVDYYILAGPARNKMMLDDWLAMNMRELATLVQQLRPSILHAQSDFFNELIVDVVGKKYGIPTVYESRGFWEESWLSRTITAKGWGDRAESLFEMYGLPMAYELRKHAEEVARLRPDHVFTLAEVMRDHIVDSSQGRINPDNVSIVPNAVDASHFPVQTADLGLKARIGLPDDAIVVGCISSMVEYEGIDTLIDAYHLASKLTDQRMCLLLVGDGNYLATLKRHVEENGISNVYFTGRVPHEEVLRYYGLIDIFVVPRKPAAVADLVTPLKPFEAFSTGRAVILSDVGALQEIANQSASVETFRAGDANDLANVLVGLLEDPGRRQELGTKAARWVRHHRSWLGNVKEYYRVYKGLGYEGNESLLVEAELELEKRGVNPGELVETLCEAPLPPVKGWFTIQDVRQTGRSILEEGWKFASFSPVPVSTLEDWAPYGAEHRSWGFHLHAWEFIDPLLKDYDETGNDYWLREAVRIATMWYAQQRVADEERDPMVWYDMSQSLRTPRLLALVLRAARVDDLRDDAIVLAAAFAWHLDELHKDRAYNPNNNHGFYTAVSQVHAAKYGMMFPDSAVTATEGRERLAYMATTQFASDGVHREHSPDYHRMLLNSFELAVNDDLIEDTDIKGRIERAARVLGWMVQPDGTLVQFGDSPETRVVKPGASSIDPETLFILSDGAQGERPTSELATFHEGGYAFVRSPQPAGPGELRRSGYLAFSAAFHSRAHKHADDLNVVWYDRGHQILVDGGRFGYGDLLPPDAPERKAGFYYAAPERQYVEGTMAHNTLMMDGRNQERRSRQPYGSALGECVESDGCFDLSGRVHHGDYIHRRRVVYQPGKQVLFKDSVFAQSTEARKAILWFNIAGHFELVSVGEDIVFQAEGDLEPLRLTITSQGQLIEPVRGQQDPLRGWRSRKDRSLEPVWSVGFAFEVETRAATDTLLRIS